ncbi:MAG: ABC transporter ATP-binding protein [Gemmatimonadetes bacterium]|nr:ABC transporter ATP-binding protein [Gemmatimonadota bacterium]
MDPVIFDARSVSYRYPGSGEPAVHQLSLTLSAGELLAIVGPNGSGKTTLLRLLLGVLRPDRGAVLLQDRPAAAWERRALARLVGVVVQREEPAFPLRVRQAVLLGRYPRLPAFGSPRAEDRRAVEYALERCDIAHLADRWIESLSGGEWQRVRVARALAQEPQALVLDEPTANLDVRHEMEVFELAAELARRERLGVILVTHHVNLAARYAGRLVVMDRGRAVAAGSPREVLTRDVLERVFAWPIETVEWEGVPQLIPLRKTVDDRS